MLGLNDAHIARRRPAGFGQGHHGHELGDGNYILERHPDIIIGGILGGPRLSCLGGVEMKADPRFADWYRLVEWYAEEPVRLSFGVYRRLEGRVGVQKGNSAIQKLFLRAVVARQISE